MTVDNMYLENIEEYVFDENKVVTYKWLSKTLSVHVNEAKRMLFTFADHQRNTKDKELSVTYLVGGIRDVGGMKIHQFYVVNEEDVETTKSRLSPVTSWHVYSVQKAKLKDSNALYTTDYTNNKVALAATASFSAIKNNNIEIRSGAERLVEPPRASEPAMEQSKPAAQVSNSKSSKKPTGIASMFSKAPVKKEPAETKIEKPQNVQENDKNNKNSKAQKKGVMSFFEKQKGKTSKTEEDSKPAAKKSSPIKGKEPVKDSKKNKKAKSDEEDDDEEIVSSKKRRRIQPEVFSSSSEEEMEEEPVPPAEPSPVPSPEPSEDEEPIPPTPPPAKSPVKRPSGNENGHQSSRRVRRRKQVDKTYMDDDGYMVTEKVWESESASEAEEPVKKVEVKKSSPPEKKAKTALKTNTKQSSLMSFFKKK